MSLIQILDKVYGRAKDEGGYKRFRVRTSRVAAFKTAARILGYRVGSSPEGDVLLAAGDDYTAHRNQLADRVKKWQTERDTLDSETGFRKASRKDPRKEILSLAARLASDLDPGNEGQRTLLRYLNAAAASSDPSVALRFIEALNGSPRKSVAIVAPRTASNDSQIYQEAVNYLTEFKSRHSDNPQIDVDMQDSRVRAGFLQEMERRGLYADAQVMQIAWEDALRSVLGGNYDALTEDDPGALPLYEDIPEDTYQRFVTSSADDLEDNEEAERYIQAMGQCIEHFAPDVQPSDITGPDIRKLLKSMGSDLDPVLLEDMIRTVDGTSGKTSKRERVEPKARPTAVKSPMDAFLTRKVSFTNRRACGSCAGSGEGDHGHCSNCGGCGTIPQEDSVKKVLKVSLSTSSLPGRAASNRKGKIIAVKHSPDLIQHLVRLGVEHRIDEVEQSSPQSQKRRQAMRKAVRGVKA